MPAANRAQSAKQWLPASAPQGSRAGPCLSKPRLGELSMPSSTARLGFYVILWSLYTLSHRALKWQNGRLEGGSHRGPRLSSQDSCCLPNGSGPLLLNVKATFWQFLSSQSRMQCQVERGLGTLRTLVFFSSLSSP